MINLINAPTGYGEDAICYGNGRQWAFNRPYVSFFNSYPNTAAARIIGGPLAPELNGIVTFKDFPWGVQVCAMINGLPYYEPAHGNIQPVGPFGFHLHESGNCEPGNPENPFASAGGHWNPDGQPHGNHTGDFPVLFSNHGIARMCFFSDRFKVSDIIGKSVVIHQNPDDYRTQPSGNSGKRLACGVIEPVIL